VKEEVKKLGVLQLILEQDIYGERTRNKNIGGTLLFESKKAATEVESLSEGEKDNIKATVAALNMEPDLWETLTFACCHVHRVKAQEKSKVHIFVTSKVQIVKLD